MLLPNPPDKILDSMQQSIYRFVWNEKNDKIKYAGRMPYCIKLTLTVNLYVFYSEMNIYNVTFKGQFQNFLEPWSREAIFHDL